MRMSTAAPLDAAVDDATFWTSLPTGHRVALFAAPVAALGALGPWARGMQGSFSVNGGMAVREVTVYGHQTEGWVVAGCALLSFLTLLLVRDAQKRSARVLGLMALATLLALAVTLSGGLLFVQPAAWGDATLLWGPPLAFLGSLVMAVGALWGSKSASSAD